MRSMDYVKLELLLQEKEMLLVEQLDELVILRTIGRNSSAKKREIRYKLERLEIRIQKFQVKSLRNSKSDGSYTPELARRQEAFQESLSKINSLVSDASLVRVGLVEDSLERLQKINLELGAEKKRNGTLKRSLDFWLGKRNARKRTIIPSATSFQADMRIRAEERAEVLGGDGEFFPALQAITAPVNNAKLREINLDALDTVSTLDILRRE